MYTVASKHDTHAHTHTHMHTHTHTHTQTTHTHARTHTCTHAHAHTHTHTHTHTHARTHTHAHTTHTHTHVQVGPSGQVDLYPLVFKLYRHTTNPAPAKSSNLPWPLASLLTSVGLLSSTPTVSAPLLTAGGDESGAAPQPRRVPYYQAAFPKSTTLAQVSTALLDWISVH